MDQNIIIKGTPQKNKPALIVIIVGAVSFRIGISYRKKIAEAEIGGAEQEAKKIVSEAAVDAENKKRSK